MTSQYVQRFPSTQVWLNLMCQFFSIYFCIRFPLLISCTNCMIFLLNCQDNGNPLQNGFVSLLPQVATREHKDEPPVFFVKFCNIFSAIVQYPVSSRKRVKLSHVLRRNKSNYCYKNYILWRSFNHGCETDRCDTIKFRCLHIFLKLKTIHIFPWLEFSAMGKTYSAHDVEFTCQ